MDPIISVIIPVYRDWERLRLCLGALSLQTIPAHRFEVIVADNDPGAGSPPFDLAPNVRLIEEPRPGSYAARNAAVAAARGAWLAFTDSDCVPGPEWLATAVRLLESRPKARFTGPIPLFREAESSRLAYVYEAQTAFKQTKAVARGRCPTANLIVARDVFQFVGPFDEKLLSGGDTEWGERAHHMGVPIHFDPDLNVEHPARRSLGSILGKRRRIAGSEAQRMPYRTLWYVLFKLLPPIGSYRRVVFPSRPAGVGMGEWAALFFFHWATHFVEAQEFLWVRMGWKLPNRS